MKRTKLDVLNRKNKNASEARMGVYMLDFLASDQVPVFGLGLGLGCDLKEIELDDANLKEPEFEQLQLRSHNS